MKTVDRAASMFLRAVLRRMKELGLNQTTLAARMHASRPYVSKVLNGDVSVTLRTATRFAKALQMDFFPILKPQEEEDKSNLSSSSISNFNTLPSPPLARS